MNIESVRQELTQRGAIIVHCSRPGRDGELGPQKPLYPEDLRATIRDLTKGGERPISCSVIWPEHQETFGEVGIIVEPRALSDIKLMNPSDAGFSEQLGGFGDPPSPEGLAATFERSSGHNEWVLVGADVRGIFVEGQAPLVARKVAFPDDEHAHFGELIVPCQTTIEDIAREFPGLPIFTYDSGALVALANQQPTK